MGTVGRVTCGLVVVSTMLLYGGTYAQAATLRVPSKYKTIRQALDNAGSGDVVEVSAGTFRERVRLKAGVTLRGAGADKSIIDGGGKGNVVEGAEGAIIEGFTIKGSGPRGRSGVTADVGINADHITMTIRGNRITNNNIGIRTYFSPSHISGNTIEGNAGHGVYVLYSAPLIRNNMVEGNKGHGIYCSYSSNTEIVNNTMGRNGSASIYSEISRVFIRNNIIAGNSGHGVAWAEFSGAQQGVEPVLSYNLIWDNHDNYFRVAPGMGDVSMDPLFVDAANGDYRLRSGSPAIDAGDPSTDLNDPDGSRGDMGAHGGPLAPGGILDVAIPGKAGQKITEADYTGQATWKEGTGSGSGNYMQYCAQCHGMEGKGDGPVADGLDIMPRDLSDGKYMKNRSDEELLRTIRDGGVASGFSESMMPFGSLLSEEDIRRVIAFIREELCHCSNGRVN